MKQRIQGIIIGFLAAAILFSGVAAATNWKTIEVAYDGYKIYVNDVEYRATDSTGVIEPFNYNGWIYAPFEHIAKALGKEVRWVSSTKSLYIDEPKLLPMPKPQVQYFFDVLKSYENFTPPGTMSNGASSPDTYDSLYKENSRFKMLGDEYTNGCTYRNHTRHNLYKYATAICALYNLRGQYKIIKGVLGRVDGTGRSDGTFSIYLDDKLYKEYPLTGDMLTQEVVIDVTGIQIMGIAFSIDTPLSASKSDETTYGFGNVTIE